MSSQSECTKVEFWHQSCEMVASVAGKPNRTFYIQTTSGWLSVWESLWEPLNTFSLFALHGYLVRLSSQYCISTFQSNSSKRKQCLPTTPKAQPPPVMKISQCIFLFWHHAVIFNTQKLSVHERFLSFTSVKLSSLKPDV